MEDHVNIALPYGREFVSLCVPRRNLLDVLEPGDAPGVENPMEAMRCALQHPIGRPPLRNMVRSGQKVVILVDDNTRPTPAYQVLSALLEELQVEQNHLDVRFLVATGTHRPMTGDEVVSKVGADIASRYSVINHRWADADALVDLGRTLNGTPIQVNRMVVESDLVITVGTTVPHCLAGWAGGAKMIQPGVSGEDTTNLTHALSMMSPMPHLGRLDNPIRMEIEQIVQSVKLDMAICCVLNQRGEFVHIVAGDSLAAHRRSVELATPIWVRPVQALADVVVVSSYPSDVDYWQGIKGLFAAELIVKRGGDIILATPCPEGIAGTPEHERTISALAGIPSREMRMRARQAGLRDLAGVNTAVVAARINELAWVSVFTLMSDAQLAVLGHTRAVSVQEGLCRALSRQGPDARVLVITHGGDICPALSV
jgi:nickel-dependent lactate racemase